MPPEAPSAAAVLLIEEGQCVACAICADVCPTSALAMERDDLLPRWIAALCTFCRQCEQECPTEAVSSR
ncbi:MAG: hypothetical protein COZ06_14410 [Armatimonadetes bacterium CG_4_10_14_3_um_filter_66_18]|nr:4Fe-4S dicluster domain-containing protein [Armatimonadota bacterium]OIP05115.1 MAG: hypothetical protein AUJ96_11570 [Armatimonadetes bacterium CG2_30_66_41]PIU95292.1 MAG: hypothetical protein COS65_03040 [Armatimonadetes bacterium CG06_land_8_20_14_3_00_66_21]PIW19761.1 MAG: hypothetical protein COW34_03490 [Armatimonadetes bacterium CG17_big_fil_post_rev_8_21_14_2_50_66_6]PIX46167.1 MAG: hypothetical protein COZ57_13255 [Armatimonadetes bacterium CG_4_8_14_3_um_filter_66_20]PIY49302.1 M